MKLPRRVEPAPGVNSVGPRRLPSLELQLRQPRVKPARGDETRMRALFDDAALIHHENAVAGEHRR